MAEMLVVPWKIPITTQTSSYTPDRKTSWLLNYAYDRIEKFLLANDFLPSGIEHIWEDPIRELVVNIGSSNGGREWAITLTTIQGKTYYISNDPSPFLKILDEPLKFFNIR